jgi:hypothetical protein
MKIDWEKFFDKKLIIQFNNKYEYKLFRDKLNLEFKINKNVLNDLVIKTTPNLVYGVIYETFGGIKEYRLIDTNMCDIENIYKKYVHSMAEFMSKEEIANIKEKEEIIKKDIMNKEAGGWSSGNAICNSLDNYKEKMEKDIEEYKMRKASYECYYGNGTWIHSRYYKEYYPD